MGWRYEATHLQFILQPAIEGRGRSMNDEKTEKVDGHFGCDQLRSLLRDRGYSIEYHPWYMLTQHLDHDQPDECNWLASKDLPSARRRDDDPGYPQRIYAQPKLHGKKRREVAHLYILGQVGGLHFEVGTHKYVEVLHNRLSDLERALVSAWNALDTGPEHQEA